MSCRRAAGTREPNPPPSRQGIRRWCQLTFRLGVIHAIEYHPEIALLHTVTWLSRKCNTEQQKPDLHANPSSGCLHYIYMKF